MPSFYPIIFSYRTAFAATLIFALALLLYGANGIRGTDQYWYLADIETIASENTPVTNTYYPGKLLREETTNQTPNYFMHNGPLLHITAKFGSIVEPYNVWIWINFLSHFVIAAVIFSVARKHTEIKIATLVSILYLISPIAVWQSINMLQEQFYAGLLAISILGVLFFNRPSAHVISSLALLIGIWSHPIFFILTVLYALVWIINGFTNKKWHRIIVGVGIGFASMIAKHCTEIIFPSSFQPNLTAIISGSVPGVSNMMWHYTNIQSPVEFSLLWDKFSFAAREHFFTPKNWPLYIYTNLALLVFPFIFIFKRKTYPLALLFTLGITLCAYVAILVLMQTQARYQQIIAAVSFVTIALALNELRPQLRTTVPASYLRYSMLSLIFATMCVSIYMAHRAHGQSTSEAVAMQQLAESFSALPDDARIVLMDSEHELKLGYLLRPREVLTVRTAFLSHPAVVKTLKLFKPTHGISTHKNALVNRDLLSGKENIKTLESMYLGNFYLRPLN